MRTGTLEKKIAKLPENLKSKLEGIVDALIVEASGEVDQSLRPKKTERKFGSLKGFVTYMADDFDAPLEDLKEYM